MFAPNPNTLALLIRARRKEMGLSQTQAGIRVGLKQKTISAFENHPEGTTLSTLFRVWGMSGEEMTKIFS